MTLYTFMALGEAILLAGLKSFQILPREIEGLQLVYYFKVPDRFMMKKIAVQTKRWTYNDHDKYTIGLRQGV